MTNLPYGAHTSESHCLSEITPRRIVPPSSKSDRLENIAAKNASAQRWRRATILANTREIIAEGGCHSLTMRELASRSSVTPPTIYNLVGERSEVIYQSICESFQVKVRYIDIVSKLQNINPILLLPDIYWMSNMLDPDYARQVISEVTHPREDHGISERIISQTNAVIYRWIRELQEQGRLRPDRSRLYEQAATIMGHHLRDTIADWAEGTSKDSRNKGKLRYDLAAGISLPLLAISTRSEAEHIELWMENLEANT